MPLNDAQIARAAHDSAPATTAPQANANAVTKTPPKRTTPGELRGAHVHHSLEATMAVSKKKRTHKVSRGEHGARKHPLTAVQKILLGKGAYAAFKPIGQ